MESKWVGAVGGTVRRLHKTGNVSLELRIDVPEARRDGYTTTHAEAKAVRLPWPMVWILPQDDHTHVREWREIKGSEDILRLWEHLVLLPLLHDLLIKAAHVRLQKLLCECLTPWAVPIKVLQHCERRHLHRRHRGYRIGSGGGSSAGSVDLRRLGLRLWCVILDRSL